MGVNQRRGMAHLGSGITEARAYVYAFGLTVIVERQSVSALRSNVLWVLFYVDYDALSISQPTNPLRTACSANSSAPQKTKEPSFDSSDIFANAELGECVTK